MSKAQKQFTGRQFLGIMLAAFGVIIAANVTLAVFATGSFPGLEVKNSYVASQQFNQNKTDQLALGWQLENEYLDGQLYLFIRDKEGRTVQPASLALRIGRPASDQQDIYLTPVFAADHIHAAVTLAPGSWQLAIDARDGDGKRFSQRRVMVVK